MRQHLEKFQRHCDIGFLVAYSSKSKAYRVFNHATGLVEETYDVEFGESNGSQGAHENLDDVDDEPLREAMKNILVGDIDPKDDEDDVQVLTVVNNHYKLSKNMNKGMKAITSKGLGV
jgi:hypothetical protein